MPRREMQPYGVFAGCNRDGIRKIAPALGLVEFGIVRSAHRRLITGDLAALEIVVGAPPLAVVGVIRALPGQQAHGFHLSSHPRRDLDGRKLGLPAVLASELQMELAIGCGLNSRKNLDVRRAAGSGVGGDIEAAQQEGSVGPYAHDSTALAAGADGLGTVRSFGEVEAQVVDAFPEGNVVLELALARGAIEIRIKGAPNVLRRAFERGAPGYPGIGAPQLSGVIYEAPCGSGQNAHFIAGRRAKRG